MDLLKDILTTSGLKKRLLHRQSLTVPWALSFPCPQSLGFHVITQGQAYLWRSGSSVPERLNQGDIAFMARGAHHHISTHPDPHLLVQAEAIHDFEASNLASDVSLVTWVSGAYQLWHDPIHPLFQELPDWFILRQQERPYADAIEKCLTVLAGELQSPGLASEVIVESLLDVLFHLVLRQIVSQQQTTQAAWGAASQDPVIGKALRLMHSQPTENWTVASLADAVSLSRAGFAQKFKLALGSPPLHYLTTLRMAKAMDLLANTDQSLTAIALAVGYQDAFGFSKSFKKKVGLSPSAFRQKNAAESDLSWRYS